MTPRHATFALFAAALAVAGCRIESYECNKSCPSGSCSGTTVATGSDTANADASCVPFCNRLEYCGLIRSGHFQDCIDRCEASYAANPAQTEAGCSCVVSDYCRPPSGQNGAYQCPGAPLVTDGELGSDAGGPTSGTSSTSGTSTSGGTTSGSSTTTGGTTGGGVQCTRNLDCALNEDCVGGACLTRCHASCECAANQSCGADGYCRDSQPPQQACTVDCDCPSGHACVSGFCN